MLHANYLPLAVFVISLITVWWLAYGRAAQIVVDRPNKRSLHETPVPRTGGLGLHAGILLLLPFVVAGIPVVVWFACAGLLIVSFVDDVRGLPISIRLTAHVLAAGTLAWTIIYPIYGLAAACVATLAVTWAINLYNFMDGSDGLAGGMTVFGFGFYGVAAWFAGNSGFALLNFSIAAAALAFLLFNFYPARIFMGDAGSVPLGFLAGAMGALGWLRETWAWWFPLLIFSPFIIDASVTLARRACKGERFWEAHHDHYYQRLVRIGWGHCRTALAEYALMLACGLAALAGLHWPLPAQIALLATALLAYAAIIGWIAYAWHRHQAAIGHET